MATLYTARLLGPTLLEKGRHNTITCPVYRDDVPVVPASGSLTVWNAAGQKVLDAVAVTISGGVATYTVTSATLSSEEYSEAWRCEWALTIAGETHTFRAPAALVYRLLYPVVTAEDLFRRHAELRGQRPRNRASYQDYLDEAWAELEGRLLRSGRRPYLILDPSALRDVHLFLTLSLVYDDRATTDDAHDDARAERYRSRYEAAWSELTFPQAKVDGTPEAGRRRAGRPTVWLCSRAS